eukprot:GHVQ01024304.1.p1 GENE.GHVQ01024304.1~~GHVQ01024304.1.p1  ORF type:complete len:174 (-),score=15.06 GHVQ01024304.1:1532-2053(-)
MVGYSRFQLGLCWFVSVVCAIAVGDDSIWKFGYMATATNLGDGSVSGDMGCEDGVMTISPPVQLAETPRTQAILKYNNNLIYNNRRLGLETIGKKIQSMATVIQSSMAEMSCVRIALLLFTIVLGLLLVLVAGKVMSRMIAIFTTFLRLIFYLLVPLLFVYTLIYGFEWFGYV